MSVVREGLFELQDVFWRQSKTIEPRHERTPQRRRAPLTSSLPLPVLSKQEPEAANPSICLVRFFSLFSSG